MSRFASALALVLLVSVAANADYRTLATSPAQDQLLDEVSKSAVAGKIVVFDLDSTLIDTRSRQVAILRAWAAREGVTELQALTLDHFQSWDFKETLKRAGVPLDKIRPLSKRVRKAWGKEFWRNESLVHDLPLPGAARYVRELHARGATVVYMGRRSSQTAGTRATLTHCGFPLDDRARLVLDEVEQVKGGRKKRSLAARAARERSLTSIAALGSVVATFENEGNKVDRLRQRWAQARVIHVRTDGLSYTQSRGPSIRGYLRTRDTVPHPGSNPDIPDPKTALAIERVPDGDTVVARTPQGEKITLRLIGIDTPEKSPLYGRSNMAGKKQRHVVAYGKRLVDAPKAWVEAKTFLIGLLDQGSLHLEYDPNNAESGHRDSTSSRRVLAYLFVVTSEGKRIDVNAELCRRGFTYDYSKRYPHKRGAEFRQLIEKAKKEGIGYWSARWRPF
jgi:endonuclease YncB( thermonuclease family)/phosphoglycolate phosphatase-like HAD superfamily hydrolase